ncbi:hypothetical protein [Mucilaginibacter ginsenosidivorax]|uniref:Uncharacterized protein n=1 Tax=Mucilaginibacter ginsenosidivorax TaxID=862126 RepID=A0A5B8W4T4_9SPHI|nr:hypothetical protein [Mucilaginibacter ginsenosidivorax]QEC78753.1 hypothetical protein FSB76_23415 [Mucilaginibacter ginsenosidivorax]
MIKVNISNYRSVLEIPRIDDKQIVYTFKFWNDSWGNISYLDLKDNKTYNGRFFLVQDGKTSEVLINFNCDECAFYNPQNPDEESPVQVLGFNSFMDSYTKPYISN